MLSRLALVGTILIQASSSLAEPSFSVAPAPSATVPPPQPPQPVRVYPVQPATGAIVDTDANAAKLAVLQQKQRECEQLQKEIRQLQSELGTVGQFSVRVQMLEVSLTKLKTLAADFTVGGGAKTIQIQDAESLRQAIASSGLVSPSTSKTAVAAGSYGFVEWLKSNNIAKEIASPTMIVSDGRPAKLFTGLEMPAPAFAAPTTPNNNLRPGIEIELTAFSRENNRVRVDIRGSVRELDDAHSIVANGTRYPAMKVRSFDTGFEGAVGEPLVLQGLVETRERTTKVDQKIQTENVEIALVAVITPNRITTPAQAVRNSVSNAVR